MKRTTPPRRKATATASASVVNYGSMTGPVAAECAPRISQVSQVTSAQDTLAQIEAALHQLAASAATELDAANAAQVSDDASRLAGEARHPRPDRNRITQLLARIYHRGRPHRRLARSDQPNTDAVRRTTPLTEVPTLGLHPAHDLHNRQRPQYCLLPLLHPREAAW